MNQSVNCNNYQDWRLRLERGESDDSLPLDLAEHLQDCLECRREQESYAETLQMLGELKSVEPPRHFFVYEEPSKGGAWVGWWRRLFAPYVLAATSCLLLLATLAAIASNLQLRTDGASLTIGLGALPVLAQPRVERDPELLQADFRRLLTEVLSARERQVIKRIGTEVSALSEQIRQTQDERFSRVLTSLDDRLAQQFQERDEILMDGLRTAALDIYQTLSTQQEQDLLRLHGRLEAVEATGQIQGNQTEVLLATVMQLAQRQD